MKHKKTIRQMSLLEFQQLFPDEQACRSYLEKRRWGNGFCCSRCGGKAASIIKTRGKHQCLGCGYQESLTANTIFHKTRTPLYKWFWMIFLLSNHKKPPSTLQIQKDLEIGSYKTAWKMSHVIRVAMASETRQEKLAGLIELDDAYFGGAARGGRRGRGAEGKKGVIIAVSKTERRDKKGQRPQKIAFETVEGNIDAEAIDRLSQRQIEKGSTVATDAFAANAAALRRRTGEIDHEPMKLGADPQKIQAHLGWVHILLSNAKRLLLGIHHFVAPKNLIGYLGEYSWRFNRRYCKNIFHQLIESCLKQSPVTLKEILAPQGLSALV
jgi:hypothetical protein